MKQEIKQAKSYKANKMVYWYGFSGCINKLAASLLDRIETDTFERK
jgi:hypothetical protein